MISVFISHATIDSAITGDVKAWLDVQGYERSFVDFSPGDGLVGGQDWWLQLSEGIKRAKVFLVLGSANWVSSYNCREELTIARIAGKPIIVLRLDGSDLGPYLNQSQIIDFRAPGASGWQALARALTEAGADPTVFRPDPGRPPFPGLEALDVADSALYFGRETEIADILTRLDQRRLNAKRLFVIAGPSGSGKSSLLRAGLVARLRRRAESWAAIAPFRPSRGFTEGMVQALEATCDQWYQAPAKRADLRRLVDPASADPDGFTEFFRRLAGEPRALPVLAVDQGEELFSAEPGPGAEELFNVLARLLAADSPVIGIMTIRSDILGQLQQHALLGPLIMDDVYALPPMPRTRYALLIDGPVAQYAQYVRPASVEPELRDTLIESATGADALPLVAYTLRALWDEYGRDDGRLLASDLRRMGGVSGAVSTIAEKLIAGAPHDSSGGDLEALRAAFVPGLAGVTERGEIVRRHVQERLLPAAARPLLDQFVQARLLVRGDGAGGPYLEIAHEALLRQWPRLAEWIQQDFDELTSLEELGRAAAAWQQEARNPELLAHRGETLAKALAVVGRDLFPRRFTAGERDTVESYLGACQEQERERTARQFSLEITATTALYERARREAEQLRFLHAAALYGAALESNPYVRDRAAVVAACGADDLLRARSLSWRVRSELHATSGQVLFGLEFKLPASGTTDMRLIFHPGAETVSAIGGARPFDISLATGATRDWSAPPDGKVLDYLPVTGEVLLVKDHEVTVVQREGGQSPKKVRLPGDDSDYWVKGRLAADGARAVVTGQKEVFLVDFDQGLTRDFLAGVKREKDFVYSISSGQNKKFAVAATREVFIVDPVTGTAERHESDQTYALEAVQLLSERRELVFGGVSNLVYILPLPAGKRVALDGHDDTVSSLTALEKHDLLVSTGWDGRAVVWDLERRQPVLYLPTEGPMLRGSAASPDNNRIALVGERSITIWRKISHRPTVRLPHGNTVLGAACHPRDRGQIVAAGFVGDRLCAAIWSVHDGEASATDLGVREPFRDVAMSPNGDYFAVCGDLPDVIVYSSDGRIARRFISEGEFPEDEFPDDDARGRAQLADEPRSPGFVANVSISYDSRHVAWVAPTGRICVGDIQSGELTIALPDSGDLFSTVRYSPAEPAFLGVTQRRVAYWVRPGHAPRALIRDAADANTFGRGTPVAFSRDGRKLAIATANSGIIVISPDSREPGLRLDGHTETFKRNWKESVGALAFDTRGDFLVSGGSRQSGGTDPRTIRLWDPVTGDQLLRIIIDGDCLALAVDPFSDTICAGNGDGLSLLPFDRQMLTGDPSAVRQEQEGILGSSYELVIE